MDRQAGLDQVEGRNSMRSGLIYYQ